MLNRYFAGTWMPRIQLDLIPALKCGAHFAIVPNTPLQDIDDTLQGGRALQRFWLTATSLGLQFQPEMTPLIFSAYARDKINFSGVDRVQQEVEDINKQLDELLGQENTLRAVFMGRLGFGKVPASRSLRLPVKKFTNDS